MESRMFHEISKVNDILMQYSQEDIHFSTKYTTKKGPFGLWLDDDSSITSTIASTATIAGLSALGGPIGALIGGTIMGISALNKSTSSTEEDTHTVPVYQVNAFNYPAVCRALTVIVQEWSVSLGYQDRLTAYFSLFNGLALYGIPKSICTQMIEQTASKSEQALLTRFADFVYAQLDSPNDLTDIIWRHFSDLDGPDCPHVVSLYLFVDAISRYLPEETDSTLFSLADRCYHRLPKEYRDFILGKRSSVSWNPATHQFLLPQLEKSPLPLKPTERGERALDYISRQIFLHLRVSLFYVQGSHLSLSAKLLALMESKEYVYQAAESVFSMQSILRDFAHTYGNMNASQLTGISEQLYMASERYNAPELRALARQIVLEARIKNDLATGIQLMHLRCVEDIEKLSQRLHSSVVTDPSDITSPDTVSSAEDLVDYALLLSLRRILIDATDRKANIARKKMGELAKAHPTLVQDFEDTVLVGGTPASTWLKQLPIPICFDTTLSQDWKSLLFFKGSFGYVFLADLLAELTFNALKYGDYSKKISFDFWSNEDFYGITMTNSVPQNPIRHLVGNGLESRNTTLGILNGPGVENITAHTYENGLFVTTVKLRKAIFIS